MQTTNIISDPLFWPIVFDYILIGSDTTRTLAERYGINQTKVLTYLHRVKDADINLANMVNTKLELNKRFETMYTYAPEPDVYKHLIKIQKKLLSRKTIPADIPSYIWKSFRGKSSGKILASRTLLVRKAKALKM